MAGYSGTPLCRKLGIKPGHRVVLRSMPEAARRDLVEGEPDASYAASARSAGTIDVQVVCVERAGTLGRELERARRLMTTDGAVWICWPKKSSGVATDLSESMVRTTGLASGLVDNEVCAVDDTWSGQRFVIRLRDRAATSPAVSRPARARGPGPR